MSGSWSFLTMTWYIAGSWLVPAGELTLCCHCLSQMKIFKDWKNWRYQRISFKWVSWTEFLFIRAFACSISMNHNTPRWIKQQSPLYHILMHGMMKLTNKSCLLFAKCGNAQSALTFPLLHEGKERKQQKGN